MKTPTAPPKAPTQKERLSFLEEAYRQTLYSLEMAATLGTPQGPKPLSTVTQILADTSGKLRKLFKFKAMAFFLVREPHGGLFLARCSPTAMTARMEEEMRTLVEIGSAAWAVQREKPVFTSSSKDGGQFILHSIATTSRIRGIFLGWLGQEIKNITDPSYILLTSVLRGCASLLEGLELYGLLRKTNLELRAKVRDLEQSEHTLRREIEQRRKMEEQLKHQALHDPLTGLPNRVLMRDRIQQSIRRIKRHGGGCTAVAFMDLDKFKLVNDTLGHDAGDKLLIQVGQRILESVRQLDTVARFGGDEFVIFLEELISPAEAIRVMKRVREAMAKPFDIDGHKAAVTGSFGLIFGDSRLTNPDRLIKNANTAMHMAKEAGRNRIRVFSTKRSGSAKMRSSLLTGLRKAVLTGRTGVLFIPTLSTSDLTLSGFEAIPSWRVKPKTEFLGDELMEMAAKEGVAWPLWRATLDKALEGLSTWRAENKAFENLSITMKLGQPFMPQADLSDCVITALKQAGIAGDTLRLEVSEESLISGGDHLITQLSTLRGFGVRLSVGDFGERFFTFHRIHPSFFESMKIDSSKLPVKQAQRSAELLSSLVSMAKALELSVVAEGVESKETESAFASLHRLGVQGQSLARPLTAEEVQRFVRHGSVLA